MNLEVFSPTIGKQLLCLGLIDEFDLHLAPVTESDSTTPLAASPCTCNALIPIRNGPSAFATTRLAGTISARWRVKADEPRNVRRLRR
jgi:hypothetical protein